MTDWNIPSRMDTKCFFEFNAEVMNDWIEKNRPGALEKLAYETGISSTTLTRCRVRRTLPTGRNLMKLSMVLNVPVARLIVKTAAKRSA